MKILPICLKTTKSTLLELYNVYLPNNSTQQNLFDQSLIKPAPPAVILGDFNDHLQMRDPLQSPDQSDKFQDWILNNDLHILNDNSAT